MSPIICGGVIAARALRHETLLNEVKKSKRMLKFSTKKSRWTIKKHTMGELGKIRDGEYAWDQQVNECSQSYCWAATMLGGTDGGEVSDRLDQGGQLG